MLSLEEVLAMAVAAIAEENKVELKHVRIISFKEIQKSSLEKFIEDNNIVYKKYSLEGV